MFDSIDAEELGNYAQLGEEQSEDRVEALKDVALDYIERYTGRALEKKARTERYPARRKVLLKAWPVESVESVTADGVELAEDEYDLDGERGILTIKAERRADALTISYTGGFTEATLPKPILAACAMIVSGMIIAGDNGGQQITYQALDGYQVTYSSKYANGESLQTLSPSATILLKPFCSRQAMR